MTTQQPGHTYVVLITRAPMEDDQQFNEQRLAIAATGARFQPSAKDWLLEFEQIDKPEIEILNELFRLAKEYGTTVRILKLTEW